MILADTSAWVEYDRATGSPAESRLAELIAKSGDLAITEPVVLEVLAGARDETRATSLRRLLLRARLIPFEAVADFEGAARLYRRCRQAGVTPRGMVDCMIATVALRTGSSLLSHDLDLSRIATVVNLELDPASLVR
ncbi:MAG: type II toxin-antitoxin system VapC family toxin [Acidimicrobiia bacterium]